MTHQSNSPIRVIIADDHPLICEGFRSLLRRQKMVQLVGEATNGKELIKITDELLPDVIIADIKMPEIDGIQATSIITTKYPEIAIIAFTMFAEQTFIIDMLEVGARGFLVKNSPKEEIIDAIKAVHDGKTYYCSHTNVSLIEMIAASRHNTPKEMAKPFFRDRELEVIKLICQGKSTREIAESLKLGIRTIEGYRNIIHEKMEVTNTAGVVIFAIKNGIYTF